MGEDAVPVVNLDRCFGCAVCATGCPDEAIQMVNKPGYPEIPKDAKALGMTRSYPLRPDWEEVKDSIMLQAVTAKFETHEKLARLLLSTGERMIVENAPMDAYWGCGPDGKGQNKLGRILMTVRDRLKA